MSKKEYNLRAGYYHNYTGICSNTDENLTTNEVVDLLNKKEEQIKELKEENKALKNTIKMYSNATRNDIDYIKELEEENEQMKLLLI